MNKVDFDHHDPDFVINHRAKYDEIRSKCPVAHSEAHGGFWVLSTYEDVVAVAKDDRRFSSAISLLIPPGNLDPLIPLQTDPPETDRFRLALMPYFTPGVVAAQEAALAADISACLDRMLAAGGGDIVHDLAVPVPARMTMRILGLPEAMGETFAGPIHRATFGEPGSKDYRRAEQQIGDFDIVIGDAVDTRMAQDRGDLISDLVHRPRDRRGYSRKEIIDLVRMIIFGGMDTVTGAVGNITALLAVAPDLQERLRCNPDLIPSAIEEFLRFEAPIQGFARKVTCPVTLGGQEMVAGDLLWLNWGAANHDPARFKAPQALDITRTDNRHLTFGIGKHLCLGARLARLELRIFLEHLIKAPFFELGAGGVVLPRTIGQLLGKKAVDIRFRAPVRPASK